MSQRVTVSIVDHVAEVRLSRPEKLNALDRPMFEQLIEAGQTLGADRSVRAIVLCGEGRAFCAGLDFGAFRAMASERSGTGEAAPSLLRRSPDSPATLAQRAAFIWNEISAPVIAAVHGVAFGGGFQIAMGTDIRYVAPDARLSVMEIKWGLIPDMSGTQTLRRLIPLDVAKELTWTGREFSGREAGELGLATRVTAEPLEDARSLAREIAARSPDAIRAGKQLLNASALVSVEEGLQLEAKLQRGLIGTPNQVEAVRANMEKRAPRFSDPE